MKKHARFLTTLLAAVLLVAAALPSAFAANAYTAIPGTTTEFNKYLVVDNDANIPAAEFGFTIAAGTAVDANTTSGTLEVLAGPGAEEIVIGTDGKTTFTAGQTTTPGAANDGITNSTDKKYAVNVVTVDLTKVSFNEPGVYRYIITETAQTDTTGRFVNDGTTTRTLDVYIEDDNGGLKVAGYSMYTGTITAGPSATANNASAVAPAANGAEPDGATKSKQYVNSVVTKNLEFGKEVTGNQGSKDKYFKFTLTIENAGNGTIVNVNTDGAKTAPPKTPATVYDAATMSAANTITGGQLTADKDGKITHDFYLADGDYILITGIPKGATYALTEAAEDYTSSNGIAAEIAKGGIAHTDSVSGRIADTHVNTGFTNTRSGVIPTGVLLTVAPFAAIMAVGAVGIIVMVGKKRKRAE